MDHITAASRTSALVIFSVLLLSGCRIYGGYGTEVKTITEIGQANDQFERSLARAENNLAALRSKVSANPALAVHADRFESIVADHVRLFDSHRKELSILTSGWSGYRSSSRLLGSIVTDHHRIANMYDDVLSRVAEDAGWMRPLLRDPATYQHVPPFYVGVEYTLAASDRGQVIRRDP